MPHSAPTTANTPLAEPLPAPARRIDWRSHLPWLIPAVLFGALVLAAIFAPWITPQNPYALADLRLEDSARAPGWVEAGRGGPPAGSSARSYLLGTDTQGRDIISAVIYGLRVSLLVGLGATALAFAAGVLLGLLAGWWRGWFEAAVMRLADVQLAFPSILIALFMMAIWGAGLGKLIIAVALVRWVVYARVMRGAVLAERERDYIAAIRALGARTPRILFAHLLPNLLTPVLVLSTVEFASIVMLEATLSFLGLGVPITRPSLGMLIKFGFDEFFTGAWWIWLFPGVTLVLLVFSLNWLADALRARFLERG